MRTREELKERISELKEQVLSNTRKKMGISEEKREDFKKRSAETKAKRQQKTQTLETSSTDSAPAGDPTLGRLRRQDLDPNRSVMAQRVEHQMKKTGMTREDAKATVLARREARQAQIADVQSQYGIGAGQARNVVQYANRNKTTPEGGGPAVANYQLAQRVVRMAKNKGLTRDEAAGVINSRRQARMNASQTPPETV